MNELVGKKVKISCARFDFHDTEVWYNGVVVKIIYPTSNSIDPLIELDTGVILNLRYIRSIEVKE